MTLILHAPVQGIVIDQNEVPDPVFAEGIIGPGFAIRADEEKRIATICAPISGQVCALQPHAFIISAPGEPPVLVHLGINTVHLTGEGFTVFTHKDASVHQGDPLITWDLSVARSAGLATIVPIVALSPTAQVAPMLQCGRHVHIGDPIARVTFDSSPLSPAH